MSRTLARLIVLSLATTLVSNAVAAEPLHVRIDRMIDAAQIGPQAGLASDEAFLRRVYLDFAGVIPTSAEARQFLDDPSPNKRVQLIDRLLGSPEYVRHMTDVFSLMLMERRSNDKDWLAYLRSSIEENKPWNQMAAEILGSDGVDARTRGPVNFYLARNVEANLMTREVGRMFFGMDLQCAQCHDHPRIDDYHQRDYYGLYAFVNRTYLFRPNKKKPAVLAEKAEGDVTFKSVFTGKEGKTKPCLPGETQIDEPTFKKGEEYKVKPDKKKKTLRPIPKYSRRERLGQLVAKGDNLAFRRNIVNRLWAHLMGRGLVHPPDEIHNANPPSHPELLDLLASEFAAMHFDIKAFLRELALTRTYQRSVQLPDNLVEQSRSMAPRLSQLQANQKELVTQWLNTDTAIKKTSAELEAAQKTLTALAAELKKANAAVTAARKAVKPVPEQLAAAEQAVARVSAQQKESQQQIEALQQQLQQFKEQYGQQGLALKVDERRTATVQALLDYVTLLQSAKPDQEALDQAYEQLTKSWSEQFVIGTLEPLSPEQMAWSVMQATGLTDRQRLASTAELNKKKPLKPEEQKDPAKWAAREQEIEEAVHAKLKGNVSLFIKLFGAAAGQPQDDFFATADQALFFANGGQLRSWLAPRGGNLADRLIKMEQPEALTEELYLSVLTRRPTAQEVADVKDYLTSRKEKSAAIQEMIWALVTSSEFRFQH
jgi:hypothetical protein